MALIVFSCDVYVALCVWRQIAASTLVSAAPTTSVSTVASSATARTSVEAAKTRTSVVGPDAAANQYELCCTTYHTCVPTYLY